MRYGPDNSSILKRYLIRCPSWQRPRLPSRWLCQSLETICCSFPLNYLPPHLNTGTCTLTTRGITHMRLLGFFFFFWLTNCVSASSRKKGWAPCGRCLLITVKRALPQLVLLKPDIDPSSHTLFTLHPPALQVVGSTPPNLWIWIVIVDSAKRMFSRCITCLENRTVADRVSRLTSGAD